MNEKRTERKTQVKDKKKDFLKEAENIRDIIFGHAEFLNENAEVGFDLTVTKKYVKASLEHLGLEVEEYGKCGIGALIKGMSEGKTVLLRADMDALSCEGGAKHLCGHHFHTAMLLGAAEILSKNKPFCGNVKLMFQPAEEILEGAKDMIDNGILSSPTPDGAMMLHVMSGIDMPMGCIVVSSAGVSAPAADFFKIIIKGKAAHGALAHQGVDAIAVSSYVLVALHQIRSREIAISEAVGLTVGKINGGESANALPEQVVLEGSIRAFNEKTRELLKRRLREISQGIAATFRAEADVIFTSGSPCLQNDKNISDICYRALAEAFGDEKVWLSSEFEKDMSGGSEDFAYVSQKIPSVMIGICAGSKKDGYEFPLHNPSVRFDEGALAIGTAAYSSFAVSFLGEKE